MLLRMFLKHSIIPDPPRWPVHKNGSTDNILGRKKSPDMSIETMVSVITKYKYGTLRNCNWSKLVYGIFVRVWLVLQVSINIKLPSFNFNFIALQGKKQ